MQDNLNWFDRWPV